MQAISLFSGAGGMDVGFKRAGFDVLWANDIDRMACETFAANGLGEISVGSLVDLLPELKAFEGVDMVFGGPPCQGFSVAGKMNPEDERSALVWSFVDVVETVRPNAFVMENVKALATLSRWESFRNRLITKLSRLGYSLHMQVLKATDYDVPQKRERMFLVGLRNGNAKAFQKAIHLQQKQAKTVRQALAHLDKAGTGNNKRICNAEITLAANPIMRKSPYAGMIFNGAGRPIDIDGYALTLPASMGGNKTPIIDDKVLHNPDAENWVVAYHKHLMQGGEPYDWKSTPEHLRRITVDEALALQTFPADFVLSSKNSSAYRMIGNAVPCNMAYAVAMATRSIMSNSESVNSKRANYSYLEPQAEFSL